MARPIGAARLAAVRVHGTNIDQSVVDDGSFWSVCIAVRSHATISLSLSKESDELERLRFKSIFAAVRKIVSGTGGRMRSKSIQWNRNWRYVSCLFGNAGLESE
jgi:hypothetical protein